MGFDSILPICLSNLNPLESLIKGLGLVSSSYLPKLVGIKVVNNQSSMLQLRAGHLLPDEGFPESCPVKPTGQ